MNLAFVVPTEKTSHATIQGSWTKKRWWDWNGEIIAPEPILALSMLRVDGRLEWTRSQKASKSAIAARLLLGGYEPTGKDVQVSFSIGDNGPRWRTILEDPACPPEVPNSRDVVIGRPFPFCAPFGKPSIELWGLVILRSQAIGARNGIWHLKRSFKDAVPEVWFKILTYGRNGYIDWKEPIQSAQTSPISASRGLRV